MRLIHTQPVDVRPTYSAGQSLVAGLLCVAAVVLLIVAVVHPTAAGAMLLGTVAVVTAVALTRGTHGDQQRRHGRADGAQTAASRTLCIPATDVCLEA